MARVAPFPPIPRPPAAVFFDCDGVLLDSVRLKAEVFRAVLRDELPEHEDAGMAYFHAHGGTSRLAKFDWIWANLVGRPLDPIKRVALGERFEQEVIDRVATCPMIPGAEEFLQRYYTRLPLFVISGTPDAELHTVLRRRGLTDYFRGIYGSPWDKVTLGDVILAEHDLEPETVVFVGDATTDRDAARVLGTAFVGVRGPHLTPFLDGSEALVDDCHELPGLFW